MNKYTIITLLILSVIMFTVLHIFDMDYKWWYLIPIYFISNYIGKVMYQTFQGFNINNISFSEKIDNDQHFTCDVVLGFTGKTIGFNGVFENHLGIDVNQLRILLYKNTNRNDVISTLERGADYNKTYKYRGKDIKITLSEKYS